MQKHFKNQNISEQVPNPSFMCECNKTSFLKKLQQNLQDFTQQLELANKKNNEISKLIEIITEERNYYQQELQKSENVRQSLEEQLGKFRQEHESKNLLINELKKANRHLSEEMKSLRENLEETKFLFDVQEQQIERIRKQKNLIQTQWNRAIKQVNVKMTKLQKKQEEEQKQNQQLYANLPLQEKVKKALRKLDRQILEQEKNINKNSHMQNNIFGLLQENSPKSSNNTTNQQFFI